MAASMPAQRRSGSSRTTYPDPTGGRTPTGSIAYRALPGARTEGYEIELSGQLPPGWQIQGGYARKVARRSGGKVSTLEDDLRRLQHLHLGEPRNVRLAVRYRF
jgi:outer membrane receptor for ferric coprogen and ferric-rhodotorulic acid